MITDALLRFVGQSQKGMQLQREAGAQAISVLESMYRDNELPTAIRPVVRDILAKWRAGETLRETA